jgi:hypothetical protein
MSRVAIILLLCVGAFVACEAVRVRAAGVRMGPNPGIVVRLKKRALDHVFSGVAKLTGKYAHKVPIPDVSATVSGVTIEAKQLQISHFAQPIIKYTLVAPNRVQGSLELPSVGLQGPFNATRSTLINTQKDSGLIVFNASQVHVAFDAKIGEFENGVPNVESLDCTANLGPSNLNVRNAKEKFAIEVLGLAAKSFRPIYNSQVCSTVKRLVTNQLNRLLAKIPNVLEVNKNLAVKYQIKPLVGPDHVEVGLFAKVLTEHVNPAQAAKFVESPAPNAHVIVLISDQVFNELSYQAFVNDKLSFTVNKDSHPLIYSLVQLDCEAETACLGNVVPSLVQKYGPTAHVELVFKASKAPEIEFEQGKAKFTSNVQADLTITPANGTQSYHDTTVTAVVAGALKVRIHEGVLYAKADVEDVQVLVDGQVNAKYTDKLRAPIEKFIEDTLNGGLLLKGLPLRLPFGASLRDPQVIFNAHTLQANTGFDYKPQDSAEDDKKPQN